RVELAGGGDAMAVEQGAAAQAVVDLERERQAGRRSADAVDGVAHVDRDALDPDGVADRDADDGAVLAVARLHGAKRLRAGVAERVLRGVARREAVREPDEVVLRADGVAVERGDDVARLDAGLRGRAPARHGEEARAEAGQLDRLP